MSAAASLAEESCVTLAVVQYWWGVWLDTCAYVQQVGRLQAYPLAWLTRHAVHEAAPLA